MKLDVLLGNQIKNKVLSILFGFFFPMIKKKIEIFLGEMRNKRSFFQSYKCALKFTLYRFDFIWTLQIRSLIHNFIAYLRRRLVPTGLQGLKAHFDSHPRERRKIPCNGGGNANYSTFQRGNEDHGHFLTRFDPITLTQLWVKPFWAEIFGWQQLTSLCVLEYRF